MEAWNDAPRDLLVSQRLGQWHIVPLPESWRLPIPCLSTDDVASDCDKVWLFLANKTSDHVERVMVQISAFLHLSKVEVGQLHDLESVVAVHTQVDSIHAVKVVVSQSDRG